MKKILFILTLALVALAGCKKEPAPAPGPEPGLTPDTPTSIVFKTSKAVGETITLGFDGSEVSGLSIDGAKAEDITINDNWRIFKLKLTSQTVTVKGDITVFDCRNNGITGITLTKDLRLYDFNCDDNDLTSLDVSGLTELEYLSCVSNKLTSLNIEGCESLSYVACYKNVIKGEAMTDIVNDLPKLDAPGAGRLVVTAEGCGNVITEDDIDIAVRKNWDVLDFDDMSPANCYIISAAGTYKFRAVKGNTNESVGEVAVATVLWESFGTDQQPEVGDLVKNVVYDDGYIIYTATSKEGNAVIAAKDISGNILWSWHIWLTDQPKEQEYDNNAGTMMDRNLGATSATPGDVGALGLLYQWGRKDPFLGSSSISSSTVAKSTGSWPPAVSSDSSRGTIAYAIANPTTFITDSGTYDGTNNYDWYYLYGSDASDNTRWTRSKSSKSIYDPCPSGWRVPDGSKNGIWSKALGSSSEFTNVFDNIDKGMNFSGKFGSDQTIWYPASGFYEDGCLYDVGKIGLYWSAPLYWYDANALRIDNDGTVALWNYGCAFGNSVRCVKE